MRAAIERDGEAQRALLEGDQHGAREAFAAAAELYRRSWESAPPRSYGRLVGMLKSAVLAGGGEAEAEYARAEVAANRDEASPTASYAAAVAALIVGDDGLAKRSAAAMRAGSDAFERTADAIAALAARDRDALEHSLRAIVEDFEAREQLLTNVPVADTALMLERLAERRGMQVNVESPMLPQSTKQ